MGAVSALRQAIAVSYAKLEEGPGVIGARQFLLAALLIGAALLLAVLLILRLTARGAPAQRIAVPAYFSPGSYWTQLEQSKSGVALAVMNPDSGPGSAPDPNYVSAVRAAHAAGITVVGYVYTTQGSRPQAAVKSDIDNYYRWYPEIGGVFFDQASTSCAEASYYAELTSYVKGKSGTAVTILNPGTETDRCYGPLADILLTFEGPASAYLSSHPPPSWVTRYPASHFWHVIYEAPTPSVMASVVKRSKKRHAGYIYVTPAGLPNPYDVLPTGRYWFEELAALGASRGSGGAARGGGAR